MNFTRKFVRDSRGAVMVMGLVMATILVGVLWHLLGVGDAIVYRERMQEAADSTAFESAVWHARTMNLLVVLNVIMSAILAILIIWRTVEALLTTLAIILFLSSFIPLPGFQALAGWSVRIEEFVVEKMLPKDRDTISPKVKQGLQRVNKAEKMVSTWAPLLDVAQPTLANTGYFGRGTSVNAAFPVSLSLAPDVIHLFRPKAGMPERMNIGSAYPSMPIQEDDYKVLCEHAAKFVPDSVKTALDQMTDAPDILIRAIGFAEGVFSKIVAKFPAFFCDPLQPDPTADATKDAEKKECSRRKKEFEKKPGKDEQPRRGLMCFDDSLSPTCLCEGRLVGEELVEDHSGCCSHHNGIKKEGNEKVCADKPPPKFDDAACRDNAAEESEKKKKKQKGVEVTEKPAAVWGEAKNGNVMFQVWSFAQGDPTLSFNDDAGVAIANSGDAGDREENASFHIALAEAEYFNDAGESMWNIGWRARLRRVHDPIELFNAARIVDEWASGKVKEAINKAFASEPGAEKALNRLDKILQLFDKDQQLVNRWWTKKAITERATKSIHNAVYDGGLDNFGSFVADQLIGTERKKIIH